MTIFRIENTTSGVILGDYEAATASDALDAMARDAGYADYADCCASVPTNDGEVLVSLLGESNAN